jgi:hypothetical protein
VVAIPTSARKRSRPPNEHDDNGTPSSLSLSPNGSSNKRHRLVHDDDNNGNALVDPYASEPELPTENKSHNTDDTTIDNNNNTNDSNGSDENSHNTNRGNESSSSTSSSVSTMRHETKHEHQRGGGNQPCILHLDSLFTARDEAFDALKEYFLSSSISICRMSFVVVMVVGINELIM